MPFILPLPLSDTFPSLSAVPHRPKQVETTWSIYVYTRLHFSLPRLCLNLLRLGSFPSPSITCLFSFNLNAYNIDARWLTGYFGERIISQYIYECLFPLYASFFPRLCRLHLLPMWPSSASSAPRQGSGWKRRHFSSGGKSAATPPGLGSPTFLTLSCVREF